MGGQLSACGDHARSNSSSGKASTTKNGAGGGIMKLITCARDRLERCTMDKMKVAQMVEVLNGLAARDAFCLLVGCIDMLKRIPIGLKHQNTSRQRLFLC
jgi:hypothetical protein